MILLKSSVVRSNDARDAYLTLITTMSTTPPEREVPNDPNPPPGTYSSTPRRPIYQTETTGSYWADVREAFKVRSSTSTTFLALHVTFFF